MQLFSCRFTMNHIKINVKKIPHKTHLQSGAPRCAVPLVAAPPAGQLPVVAPLAAASAAAVEGRPSAGPTCSVHRLTLCH